MANTDEGSFKNCIIKLIFFLNKNDGSMFKDLNKMAREHGLIKTEIPTTKN